MHVLSTLLFAGALVSAQTCKIQFDGRFPSAMTPADLDTKSSPYNTAFTIGQNLKFSQIVTFPKVVTPSLFDGTKFKAAEISINDKSIFAPSTTNVQVGFRRAELMPVSNDGKDASTDGVKTLHFSVMSDPKKPLNFKHEYQLVFLEDSTFSTNQFVLKTGTILSGAGANSKDPKTLFLVNNVNSKKPEVLFSTPFTDSVFHNFGVVLDFKQNKTQVLYSTGSTALAAVSQNVDNNVSGKGQFHFGILKKPIGATGDISKTGTQESGIHESVIYAGIFEEDSSCGCVSTSAAGAGAGAAGADPAKPAKPTKPAA